MSDTMKRMWTDRQIRSMADESAKIRIEAGQTSNAKPIYCHALSLYSPTDKFRLACLIFNNDATAFTASTFVDWIDNLYTSVGDTIRIATTGAFVDNDSNNTIASYLGKSISVYYFLGISVDGNQIAAQKSYATKADLVTAIQQFNDGVNKIN